MTTVAAVHLEWKGNYNSWPVSGRLGIKECMIFFLHKDQLLQNLCPQTSFSWIYATLGILIVK